MALIFSPKLKSLFGSLAAAAVLLLVVFLGISRGQQQAQAQVLVRAAQSTSSALQFFYTDQNRYPTVLEFNDQNVMLNYQTVFPLPQFASKTCPQSFVYKNISNSSFQLDFCLPTAALGYQAGWNIINGDPATPSTN